MKRLLIAAALVLIGPVAGLKTPAWPRSIEMRRWISTAALVLVASGCNQTTDAWTLFWYPRGVPGSAIITPGFPSLELCRLAASEAKEAYPFNTDAMDYECGKGCYMREGMTTVATCGTTER